MNIEFLASNKQHGLHQTLQTQIITLQWGEQEQRSLHLCCLLPPYTRSEACSSAWDGTSGLCIYLSVGSLNLVCSAYDIVVAMDSTEDDIQPPDLHIYLRIWSHPRCDGPDSEKCHLSNVSSDRNKTPALMNRAKDYERKTKSAAAQL